MKVRYAVTFEFETRPPITHRGTVVAASGATCVARAVRSAQTALRPKNWTSLVCVLLERYEAPSAEVPSGAESGAGLLSAP